MNAFTQRLIPIEVEESIRIPASVPGGEVRTIMVKVPAMKDPKDGEIYFGVEASEILDKAKARHMGVLAPQELAELRQRLGLTQKEIAEVLQIGEKTWSRWETGREIVSRSLNVLLRAVYEGNISLPWLRAKLNPDKAVALAPRMRIFGGQWEPKAAHVLISSTWMFPGKVQQPKVEAMMNAWSLLTGYAEPKDTHRFMEDSNAVDGLRHCPFDFAHSAGNTEEMPLGA
jgi:DNA-binding transcriptional regulator YiaG